MFFSDCCFVLFCGLRKYLMVASSFTMRLLPATASTAFIWVELFWVALPNLGPSLYNTEAHHINNELSIQTVKTAFLCVFGMNKWLGVDVMEDFNALPVQFIAGHLWLSVLGLAHLAKIQMWFINASFCVNNINIKIIMSFMIIWWHNGLTVQLWMCTFS